MKKRELHIWDDPESEVWPNFEAEGSCPAQCQAAHLFPEFPCASMSADNKELITLDFSIDHAEERSAPPYPDILYGARFGPAELILYRVGKTQSNSCPSLWTGSTKDIESVPGDETCRRPGSSDRYLKGLFAGTAQPEPRVFLLSEPEAAHDPATVGRKETSELSDADLVSCFHSSPKPLEALVPPTWDSLALQNPAKYTKSRPHVCHTCQRAFARSEHLQRHERSHAKIRSYPCTECDQRVATAELLAEHQELWHAKKPYTNVFFDQKKKLTLHN
jgi:uncharacterized protein YlaI